MKSVLCPLAALCASLAVAAGSEEVLGSIFLPVDPMVDRPVEVRELPYSTSGAFPEGWFSVLTERNYERRIAGWRREYEGIFYHSYSERCFAVCLQRGWLKKEDLVGLAPDRIGHIEKIKGLLPKD